MPEPKQPRESVFERRPRMAGWLTIVAPGGRPNNPQDLGGLVEISRNGGRLYLMRPYKIGDRIDLGIRFSEEGLPVKLPCRVKWLKKDEPGNSLTFDIRLRYLQEMVARRIKVSGMAYGYLYGVEFDMESNKEAFQRIERALQNQKGDSREVSSGPRLPDISPNIQNIRPS